ncbi:MAG: hypothetical protein WCF03_12730 [Nitrososphaeraceae archaeon]
MTCNDNQSYLYLYHLVFVALSWGVTTKKAGWLAIMDWDLSESKDKLG